MASIAAWSRRWSRWPLTMPITQRGTAISTRRPPTGNRSCCKAGTTQVRPRTGWRQRRWALPWRRCNPCLCLLLTSPAPRRCFPQLEDRIDAGDASPKNRWGLLARYRTKETFHDTFGFSTICSRSTTLPIRWTAVSCCQFLACCPRPGFPGHRLCPHVEGFEARYSCHVVKVLSLHHLVGTYGRTDDRKWGRLQHRCHEQVRLPRQTHCRQVPSYATRLWRSGHGQPCRQLSRPQSGAWPDADGLPVVYELLYRVQ